MDTNSESKLSDNELLRGYIEHQIQLKKWLSDVEQKIVELEESYLEETPGGNIIKGWDVDSKSVPIRPRPMDDKERIFSCSSYQVWMESRASMENEAILADKKAGNLRSDSVQPQKLRKHKKNSMTRRDSGYNDDWEDDL